MEKRPFLVSLEIEYACLAEDEYEAKQFANRVVDDLFGVEDYCDVQDLHRYPDGWEEDGLVYHRGKEDITLAEALDMAKALKPPKDIPGQLKMFEKEKK